jgi:Beta-eliminating lyase
MPSLGASSVSAHIPRCNVSYEEASADTITGTICLERCPIHNLPHYACIVPSKELYAYATLASLGDDVYEEPSTQRFEKHVAQLFGKGAALFVSSGSMSNQIALRAHLTQPPHSVLCDIRSHINRYVQFTTN